MARDVFPERGELVLRVESTRLPSVRITGVVVDEDGRGVGDAQLTPTDREAGGGAVLTPEADGSFDLGPYPPGTLSLWVRSTGFPGLLLGPRELQPGETWDCGEIVLRPGGTLLVSVSRDARIERLEPQLGVREGPSWRGRLHADGQGWRSDALAPGAYRLSVQGKGIAAGLVPFEIRSGETEELQLTLAPGSPVKVRVEGAAGEPRRHPVIRIRDAHGATLVEQELWSQESGVCALDLALAPGQYRVEASSAEQRAEADLIVAPEGGPAELVLELR